MAPEREDQIFSWKIRSLRSNDIIYLKQIPLDIICLQEPLPHTHTPLLFKRSVDYHCYMNLSGSGLVTYVYNNIPHDLIWESDSSDNLQHLRVTISVTGFCICNTNIKPGKLDFKQLPSPTTNRLISKGDFNLHHPAVRDTPVNPNGLRSFRLLMHIILPAILHLNLLRYAEAILTRQ